MGKRGKGSRKGSRVIVNELTDLHLWQNPPMDATLWQHLPTDLVESCIFSKLPLRSLVSFRRVCKSWENVVKSKRFSKLREGVPPEGPLFLLYTYQDWNAIGRNFDPSRSKWDLIPVPPKAFHPLLVASDGGLICSYQGQGLVVVLNPVTATVRILPMMPSVPLCMYVISMAMDKATKSYTVFTAGLKNDGTCNVEIYDSRVQSWYTVPENRVSSMIIPQDCRRWLGPTGVVCLKGTVHLIGYANTPEDAGGLLVPGRLLSFRMRDNKWRWSTTRFPRLAYEYQDLVKWNDCLFMIGACLDDERNYGESVGSICLWKLRKARSNWPKWVLVDRMPRDLFLRFLQPEGRHVSTLWLSCTGCSHRILLMSKIRAICTILWLSRCLHRKR